MSEPRDTSENYSLRGLLFFVRDKEARRVTIITITAAICLTLCHYYSQSRYGNYFFDHYTANVHTFMGFDNLHRLVFWAGTIFLCYFLIPALVVKLVLRENLSDFGIARTGILKGLKTYVILFLLIFPLILFFSYNEHFQATYPFFKLAKGYESQFSWQRFLGWELIYGLQFLGVEFFFRGFILHGLKKTAGHFAIAAMVLPYCMIHFGKPMPEAIGSIVAGYILGYLSLKSKNIFPGMILHISVALSMDLLSLWHRGII